MLRTGVVFLIVTAAFSGCTDSSTTPADAPEQARPQSSRTSKQGGDPPNNAFPGRDPAPQKGFTYQPLMDFRVPFATAPGQASPTKQVEIGGNYTTVRVTSPQRPRTHAQPSGAPCASNVSHALATPPAG